MIFSNIVHDKCFNQGYTVVLLIKCSWQRQFNYISIRLCKNADYTEKSYVPTSFDKFAGVEGAVGFLLTAATVAKHYRYLKQSFVPIGV